MTEAISKQIEAAIADPSLRPDSLKPVFEKIESVRKSYAEINKGIQQAQGQLEQLYSNRDKTIGAGEILTQMLVDAFTTVEPEVVK